MEKLFNKYYNIYNLNYKGYFMEKKKKFIVGTIMILVIILIDQLMKIGLTNKNVDIIPGVLTFKYLKNYGVAFGFGKNINTPAICVNLILVTLILLLLVKVDFEKKICIPLFMIIGGAISNCIDRIFRGFIVDFFYVRFFKFPVFNVADIFITVGILSLMIFVFISLFKKETNGVIEGN